MASRTWLAVVVFTLTGAVGAAAQTDAPGVVYRVFLKSGEALPSYGEPAPVGERVIFTLMVGGDTDRTAQFQLISLPIATVDLPRTSRYTDAMRAAQYAATRGDEEYAAMSVEVARSLDLLKGIPDPKRRLDLAIEARRRLVAWSRAHFSYRASDIRQLAGTFDDVINQLRLGAGEAELSFELVSMPQAPGEALAPPPHGRNALVLALGAAEVADVAAERVAILRAAVDAAGNYDDLTAKAAARLQAELRTSAAYAALSSAMLDRATKAYRRGDVNGVLRAQREVARQDRRLGARRPEEVRALMTQVASLAEAARTYRRALDLYVQRRVTLQRYGRWLEPLLAQAQQLQPVLMAIRETRGLSPARARRTSSEAVRLQATLMRRRLPAPLLTVQSTLASALQMAREACARHLGPRPADVAAARDAAAAAAGFLLLTEQAKRDLTMALRPPTPESVAH
ncbi:MAG: hypothetical protein ABI051_09670 [Vicinamibacterales bacterium]